MVWYKIKEGVDALNSNTFFIGTIVLFSNIASRYIQLELTQTQEEFLQSEYVRKFAIFAMAFVATRDIVKAFLLTAAFTAMLAGPLHERSKFCVLPERFRNQKEDGAPSRSEVEKAQNVLKRHEDAQSRQYEQTMMKQKKAAGVPS
jgi:hypothetical protein